MAQTRRRRQTKHRGNAAGVVESRGRTGRKPTAAEKSGKAGDAARAKAKRLDRRDRPPTWTSAFYRAMVAAILFLLAVIVLFNKSTQAIKLFPIVLAAVRARSATTPTCGCSGAASAAKPSEPAAEGRRPDERRVACGEGVADDERSRRARVHSGAGPGEHLHRPLRYAATRGCDRGSRRRGRPPARRGGIAWGSDRGDPHHALPLRSHRRGRAGCPGDRRARSTARRSSAACWRTS